jgi:hypothetical protein
MIAANVNAPSRRGPRVTLALVALALASALLAPAASAAVQWSSEVEQSPTNLPPGGRGIVWISASNAGETDAGGWPTVDFQLPAGVTAAASPPPSTFWSCTGPSTVSCSYPFGAFFPIKAATSATIGPGTDLLPIRLTVDVSSGAPQGRFPLEVTLSGAGGATVTQTHELRVGAEQLPFGPKPDAFEAGAFDKAGNDYTQAGGHPEEVTVDFELNTRFAEIDPGDPGSPGRSLLAVDDLKDVVIDSPAGFAGDPTAVPECPDLGTVERFSCPAASQVGVASISPTVGAGGKARMFAVYNVAPARNHPAEFAFKSPIGTVLIVPSLRSDGDWGISATVRGVTQIDNVWRSSVTLWGVPADPGHDAQRCDAPNFATRTCVGYDESGLAETDKATAHTSDAPLRPFLTNPTRCTGQPDVTRAHVSSYQDPAAFEADGDPDLGDPNWKSAIATSPPLSGCEKLQFEPSVVFQPTTEQAASPTGLHVEISIPQNEEHEGLATAHLKDTTVLLPEGMTVNPASAAGLGACTSAQIGLTSPVGGGEAAFDKNEPSCPLSSKIGTVEVQTPLLDDPLGGDVYLAKQFDNPFGSLLAIYLVVRGPGIVGKIAGHVEVAPGTGRLSTTVLENPQAPISLVSLDLKSGPRAPLVTPGCGTHTTMATLTSWAAPSTDVVPTDSFEITRGPGGKPCPNGALDPRLSAGVLSPIAGDSSPFVFNLSREDGSGLITAVDVQTPEGLLAKLAGIPYCPEAAIAQALAKGKGGDGSSELSSPSCPAASQIGTALAGAGAGNSPFYVDTGRLFLAGPYKGAPVSMVGVIPALAGPFDLGVVVTRVALHVDSRTTRIQAISDPIPTALHGIPLNVRDIRVALGRSDFMRSPTDCSPMSVDATVHGAGGQSAVVSNRFQLSACRALEFKPKLSLRLFGPTHRSAHPKFVAKLVTRRGDSNIRRVTMVLPGTELLENAHIRTICTRARYAADACPAGSVYGYARAWSPLLDRPLEGPVYLRSSNHTLPDFVASLGGQIHLDLVGRIDSVNARIRNTFDIVPDAPVSKFVLTMHGGKKGLLVNNTELCKAERRASVKFYAHNGRRYDAQPLARAGCRNGREASK